MGLYFQVEDLGECELARVKKHRPICDCPLMLSPPLLLLCLAYTSLVACTIYEPWCVDWGGVRTPRPSHLGVSYRVTGTPDPLSLCESALCRQYRLFALKRTFSECLPNLFTTTCKGGRKKSHLPRIETDNCIFSRLSNL